MHCGQSERAKHVALLLLLLLLLLLSAEGASDSLTPSSGAIAIWVAIMDRSKLAAV
jgi:hypothetical protein